MCLFIMFYFCSGTLTDREDASEHVAGVAEGAAVPATVPELVLTLLDAQLGPRADRLEPANRSQNFKFLHGKFMYFYKTVWTQLF